MTKERIWRLDKEGDPTPLDEAGYDDEDKLQELIANHPEVLEGITPDEPRRWLLIKREMGIPDSQNSSNRWPVDHLLIDQDGVPTLVEAKLRRNPEIRREVVGQLLEYAAHATRYWTGAEIRRRFEAEHGGELQARLRFDALLNQSEAGEGGYETFWELVGTNLRTDNVRLLFAVDQVPDELAHVVAFLNRNMERVEVLAVELRQFGTEEPRTLVPRVVGRSDSRRVGGIRRRHTMETLVPEFPEGAIRDAARTLLERSERCGAILGWGAAGVSIRVRSPAWPRPVSIAWLAPEGSRTGMGTRDFSFGSFTYRRDDREDDLDPPERLLETVSSYRRPFETDGWAQSVEPSVRHNATPRTVWEVKPEDAAEHIETLASRVEDVLRELAALPPATE